MCEERLESTPPVATTSSAGNNASLSSGMHVFDSRNRVTKLASRQDEMQELRGRVKALEYAIARQGAPIHTPETLGDLSDAGRPDGVAEVVESLPDQCFRGSNGGTRYVGRSNYALFMSLVSFFPYSMANRANPGSSHMSGGSCTVSPRIKTPSREVVLANSSNKCGRKSDRTTSVPIATMRSG